MKRNDLYTIRFVLIGVVAAIVVSGRNVKADFTFGEPVNLGSTVNSPYSDAVPCISADGLELYFASLGANGFGIWVSTRNTTDGEWGPPENLGPVVNNPLEPWQTAISTDGLELYIQAWERAASGSTYISGEIWVTRRAAKGEPWGEPVKLDLTVPGWDLVSAPSLTADGLELCFGVNRFADDGNRADIYITKRETTDAPWGEPASLGPIVNDWTCQVDPRISGDGLVLVLADWWACSSRPVGFGDVDMWMVRRATRDGDWGSPVNLGPAINSAFEDRGGMISADGSTLYFHSDRPGGSGRSDLWQAPILPVVDFDDDGSVGTSDLTLMIESWGTDEPLCDIGPMPWGDGVVDEADLGVLMGYWDPSLLGWWTLDEGEGTTAVDWSGHGGHGGFVGEPQWVDGYQGSALEFSGSGQYVDCGDEAGAGVTADFTLAAWVQMTPDNAGQYMGISGKLSRLNGDADYMGFALVRHSTNVFRLWVGVGDPENIIGRASSDVAYTDTDWHHVAGIRKGQTNALYVDGVRQAATTTTDFVPSEQFFYIGRQYSNTATPRHFKGKIDDVRLYNRALTDTQIAEVMGVDTNLAGSPSPDRDALLDVRDIGSLSWSRGDTAASHDVYFGTAGDAVASADNNSPEFQGNQAGTSFSLVGLAEFGGGDYYWRIDEIEADGTVHTGMIWKFTVPDYLIVDDFENYADNTNAGATIFHTWLDGMGYGEITEPEPAPAYWGNGTGAIVGHASGPPFAEQTLVHGGYQSMPLWYDHDGTILEGTEWETKGLPFYSEAQRHWETPQDWTVKGAEALTLWFHGDPGNATGRQIEPLYVALEDATGNSAVIVHPDPHAIAAESWQQWPMDLSDFLGVDLTAITMMSIGVGDPASTNPRGSGVVYIDDIELHLPPAP